MIEKVCTKCKVKKNKLEFHKNKRSSDGLKSMCKKCKNQYYLDNSEKIKLKAKKRYIIKKDQIKEYQKIYKKNNREKINLRERNYKKKRRVNDEVYILKENLSCLIRNGLKLYNHKKNTKTLKILGLNFKDFKEYLNNNKYGFSYLDKDIDLDHIIPITSPIVCGLHVSWNMQYLTRSANSKKGNSLPPPHQYIRGERNERT